METKALDALFASGLTRGGEQVAWKAEVAELSALKTRLVELEARARDLEKANAAVDLARECVANRARIRELRLDRSALIATVEGMLRQHDTGELCFGFDRFEMARVILARVKDGTLIDPDVLKVEREEQEARTLLGDRTC